MADTKWKETGIIHPRHYGVRLGMPRSMDDLFVAPSSYVIAQVMLEKTGEIRNRVADWAERHGHDYQESLESLVEGVDKKEGTRSLLNYSRRTKNENTGNATKSRLTLKAVKRYENKITARVKSKGRDGYLTATLPFPNGNRISKVGYPGASVLTEEHAYNEVKGKDLTIMNAHIAAVEIALRNDYDEFGLSFEYNITGLKPRERIIRGGIPQLPFTFNQFGQSLNMKGDEKELYELTTDLFMDYYVGGKTQTEIDEKALTNLSIFGAGLRRSLSSDTGFGSFKYIRQKAQERDQEGLSRTQFDLFGATTTLIDNIAKSLSTDKRDYFFAGYVREFAGTKWQGVARRFEPRSKGPSYSVMVVQDHNTRVPLVIRHNLEHKTDKWYESADPMPDVHPFKRVNKSYDSVDDMTRREAQTTVILPDEKLAEGNFDVPQNLKQLYDRIRTRNG